MIIIYLKHILAGFVVPIAPSMFILLIILLGGCSPASLTTLVSHTLESSPKPVLETDRMLETLTGRKWQLVREQIQGLTNERITWEFYPDKTFRQRFTSDYTLSYEGAWAIAEVSEEKGVIFLAGVVNDPDLSSRYDVLSFEFRNGGLKLGEVFYQETPFTEDDIPPQTLERDQETVTDPKRAHFFALWDTITSVDWRSKSTPPPGDPVNYSFKQDGTFTARFAVTQCQYSGRWSLSSLRENSGNIRFSIPANECDVRGPRDAFVREMPVTLRDSDLFLYETVYDSVLKGGDTN